ncbi:conjugal transfer protein TraB [Euryarchaeota archaeon ex4484_162]|nr:MAG: conjugal transfer protein TraB [Euryarchaeota archaeon ex4484_162]RLF27704.1 MAG: TraB family protein [Thermoplasmata archaeon]RLF36345.1 MAG: TraB family protein [Thermoplasmata archaeon]
MIYLLVRINDNIVLVGTAHISRESVEEVKNVIREYRPDIVAVELCSRRYRALTEKDAWENTPVTSLLKSSNAYLILAQTILSSIQRKLGKEYGVEPGSEMIAAIREAEEMGLEVALVDRDISVTLKRAWRKMGVREKFRLTWEFLKAVFGISEEELERIDLKELMNQDVISAMMKEFSEIAPSAASVLIDERDRYIAKKIFDESKKGRVVAVVGAGHIDGIKKCLETEEMDVDLNELEMVPRKRFNLMKTLAYAVPIIFFSLLTYIVLFGNWERAAEAFLWWILINGGLSAAGAAVARAHPLSIATAFVAAPFTSLNPAVAAGWFAGLVEAKLRTPMVKDIRSLSRIDNLHDMFNNKFIRLLMVVALANLGSMIGTFVALPYIISLGLL